MVAQSVAGRGPERRACGIGGSGGPDDRVEERDETVGVSACLEAEAAEVDAVAEAAGQEDFTRPRQRHVAGVIGLLAAEADARAQPVVRVELEDEDVGDRAVRAATGSPSAAPL
jgi:hypothetical protein